MSQKIEPMSDDDLTSIKKQRNWALGHDPLEAILCPNWIEPDETRKLKCLGISFGDALVQELKMELVTVSAPGTTINLFPLTAIFKLIKQAVNVGVRRLYKDACQNVKRLRAQLLLIYATEMLS